MDTIAGDGKKQSQYVCSNKILTTKDMDNQSVNQMFSPDDYPSYLRDIKKRLKAKQEANEDIQSIVEHFSPRFAKNGQMRSFIQNISLLDFEARKDVAFLFRFLLQRSSGVEEGFTVQYLESNFDILRDLMHGYKAADSSSACCGLMLRECAKYEELAKRMLEDETMEDLFDFVQLKQFDIASDAFSTLRELLVNHKAMVAKYLDEHYERFFNKFTELLKSESYVTKRQALRMLLDVLLDRKNIHIMTKYIQSPENLKLMMNLLKDHRRAIHNDALHMFKVFVCNPKKDDAIIKILQNNKPQLISFFTKMEADEAEEDEDVHEDRELVLSAIRSIRNVEPAEGIENDKMENCNGAL